MTKMLSRLSDSSTTQAVKNSSAACRRRSRLPDEADPQPMMLVGEVDEDMERERGLTPSRPSPPRRRSERAPRGEKPEIGAEAQVHEGDEADPEEGDHGWHPRTISTGGYRMPQREHASARSGCDKIPPPEDYPAFGDSVCERCVLRTSEMERYPMWLTGLTRNQCTGNRTVGSNPHPLRQLPPIETADPSRDPRLTPLASSARTRGRSRA